jgi:hypothetical protein
MRVLDLESFGVGHHKFVDSGFFQMIEQRRALFVVKASGANFGCEAP